MIRTNTFPLPSRQEQLFWIILYLFIQHRCPSPTPYTLPNIQPPILSVANVVATTMATARLMLRMMILLPTSRQPFLNTTIHRRICMQILLPAGFRNDNYYPYTYLPLHPSPSSRLLSFCGRKAVIMFSKRDEGSALVKLVTSTVDGQKSA